MRIQVPQINEYSSNIKGWNNFLHTINPAFRTNKQICFNFKKCGFISTEGIALLAGVKFLRDVQGYQTIIDEDTIRKMVKIVLDRWGFLGLFGSEQPNWKRAPEDNITTLSIYRQQNLDINGIVSYIDAKILSRTEMPDMSELLRKEIRKAFFEIFSNIFNHSNSPIGGIVCGQIFPHDKKIQIVFYDAGIGIAQNVRNSQPSITLDEEAIEWALRRGTSTLSSENVSRGLGLYLIQMFLKANGGEFRIYANKGAVMEFNGQREIKKLPYPIKGTLIDMRIIIRDDIKYTLFSKDEI
jgi:anti-sigma regulatory factor (Ser/Thr protein kinase)